MSLLTLTRVTKKFTDRNGVLHVLQPISLGIEAGEFVCLVGPSGSGKSTLLRIAGGLLKPDSGTVHFADALLTQPRTDIGFVFQARNLMPWRTVEENVLLPVQVQQGRVDDAARDEARRLIALMGLAGFEQSLPRQLSGGMQQRVVLARTLMQQPRLLLLDEPFGALDALTRERLNLELLRIRRLHAATVLMVTHSIAEAVFLADRVVALSPRPARIVGEVAVDLPRPRQLAQMSEAGFGHLTLQVRELIGQLA
ncbi:MAG: ABC transporter ATP-binding protein [Caldilineaceae bacterium]|nr:ABC transporter ATP-binding protein [Caldilineaceae bacterium]